MITGNQIQLTNYSYEISNTDSYMNEVEDQGITEYLYNEDKLTLEYRDYLVHFVLF